MPRSAGAYSAIRAPINISLGLGGGLAVGSATAALGGSWLAIPTCALFGIATGKFFALETPTNTLVQALINVIRKMRLMPKPVRILSAAALVGCATAINAAYSVVDISWGFYIYIVPIFLSAVLLGRKAAIAATLLSLLAVAYFVIPPRNSFVMATLWDIVCFGVFPMLAVIILMITGTQSAMSPVCPKWRAVPARRNLHSEPARNVKGEIMQYLRAEAHHLTQIARTCGDVRTAQELEGISVELMERAAEMEKVFNVRPNLAN